MNKQVALLTHGVNRLTTGPQGGSGVVLLQDRQILEDAGWQVRVWGSCAEHDLPVEQIAVHLSNPHLSILEYAARFVRRNPESVLLSYDVPTVALLAPRRTIIQFNWEATLPRYWRLMGALSRFRSATYMFPSETARSAWCSRHSRIPVSQTHVIWNAVDLQSFYPADRNGNSCRVGFAGQWIDDKGLGVLSAAWPMVRAEIPDAELWLAGGTDLWQRTAPVPDEQFTVLHHLDKIRSMGLQQVGLLPPERMPAFWSAVDVAGVPSICNEQFGLVALEAMACGVPVVVSDTGALPEVGGDAAVVVQKGDPKALADALVELLRSSEQLARLGERARQRATMFSLERRRSDLLDLIEQVANAIDH